MSIVRAFVYYILFLEYNRRKGGVPTVGLSIRFSSYFLVVEYDKDQYDKGGPKTRSKDRKNRRGIKDSTFKEGWKIWNQRPALCVFYPQSGTQTVANCFMVPA
jgi:hypothetical protein